MGTVGDLPVHGQQRRHRLDVGHRLLDLAVDHAEEVQRLVELQQVGVAQNEVAQRHRTAADAVRRHAHDDGKPKRDDRGLADVEQRQALLALHRGLLVGAERRVVAARLVLLVAEILDGLVVQQAVDGLGVGLAVGVVHGAAELDAPFRHEEGVGDVAEHRHEGRQREPAVEHPPQDDADQPDFHQRRHDGEQRVAQQRFDGPRAALQRAGQAAGLPFEVEAQAEGVQVAEDRQGDPPDRALRHLGEDGVAQLREDQRHHARQAVGDDQAERDRHRRPAFRRGQRVHRLLVEDGDVDVRRLGADQQQHRQRHADAHFDRIARPEIRQERAQGREFARAGRRPGVGGGWAGGSAAAHGNGLRRNFGKAGCPNLGAPAAFAKGCHAPTHGCPATKARKHSIFARK